MTWNSFLLRSNLSGLAFPDARGSAHTITTRKGMKSEKCLGNILSKYISYLTGVNIPGLVLRNASLINRNWDCMRKRNA